MIVTVAVDGPLNIWPAPVGLLNVTVKFHGFGSLSSSAGSVCSLRVIVIGWLVSPGLKVRSPEAAL
jgi:hypothetical protein